MGLEWDDTDWFRSSTWNPEIAAAFEARLKRARTRNRAQYLRIQGTHLVAQEDPGLRAIGRILLRRVVDEYSGSDRVEALFALEQLGDSLAADGDDRAAEAAFREVLARIAVSPTGRSGTSHTTELSLAELLHARGDDSSLEEADDLLDRVEVHVKNSAFLRNGVLRYLVARGRVASARGDHAAASAYARRALSVAAETEPSLPRHPDVGRPTASTDLLAEMRLLAGDEAS